MAAPKFHPNRIVPAVTRPYIDRIRVARLAQGMSTERAAERLGIHRAAWGNVENGSIGSPSFDTVHAMARAVGLSLDLVPEGAPPPEYLPPLDGEQVRAVAMLAVWYRSQNPGPLPRALESAIEILRDYADRPPRRQAHPEQPRHIRDAA